jgi:predicted enzyme related to lactoylglutathione lyase
MQPHGPFVWHELMVPNTSSAPAFYQNITGWGTQKFDGGMDYTMWTNGQAPVGGLMELPEELKSNGVPPHWLHYVGVNDVDATAKKAEELGGHVNVPPTDIPDVGRFAVLADPQGAVVAIYKSSQDNPAPGEPQIGEFSWHELATTDRAAAFDFYSKLFGWKETSSMDMGGGMTYQMFGVNGGAPIGGMFTITEDMQGVPPNWLGYVLVKNVDDAVTAVQNSGGQLMNGPMDIPGGRIAVFADPQGAHFAVHQQTG